MKKHVMKPGFEFIFTLSILAVLGLPPLVFAQNTKDVQISIVNGDTTVNGTNIKYLSARDRERALKDISKISMIDMGTKGSVQPPMANSGDGTVRTKTFRYRQNGRDSSFAFNYRLNDNNGPRRMNMDVHIDRNPAMEFDHKNSQVFNYVTTDNNGVSTHVTYRVSEPTGALAHMGATPDKGQLDKLDVTDLNIVPEFSAGKTVLIFNLPSKAVADVQLKDSRGNLIWSDKVVNGSFIKTFPLGLNGVYYLRIEQKGQLAIKKIFKEQM